MSRMLAVPPSVRSVVRGGSGVGLRFPVFIVVLRGDDHDHREDGAQHDGGNAHSQAYEREVSCLA